MKIVVIGGTGLIGSKLVTRLRAQGHEVLAASPNSGVNTLTGEGLDAALVGAQVVVDVSNSPSFEDKAAMDFFQTASRNIATAENLAGVRHHVALSVVGTDRLQASGYFRAKQAQEDIIRGSGVPYTILHATQFFEFMASVAQAGTVGDKVRVSSWPVQPIAADDVADAMAEAATGAPRNGMKEIAGPERLGLNEIVARLLKAKADPREVSGDPDILYFGVQLNDRSLVPSQGAWIGPTTFDAWLAKQPK